MVVFFSTCFYQLPEHTALGITGWIIFILSLPEIFTPRVNPVGSRGQYTDPSSAKGTAGCCLCFIWVMLFPQPHKNSPEETSCCWISVMLKRQLDISYVKKWIKKKIIMQGEPFSGLLSVFLPWVELLLPPPRCCGSGSLQEPGCPNVFGKSHLPAFAKLGSTSLSLSMRSSLYF